MTNRKRVAKMLFGNAKAQPMKIELGLVDDLKELITDAKRIIALQEDGVNWGKKAESQVKEVGKVVSDAEGVTRGAISQAANLKTESDSIFNKVEIASKDLGINVNSIKDYQEAFKLTSKMFENQNELNGWNEYLKKLL